MDRRLLEVRYFTATVAVAALVSLITAAPVVAQADVQPPSGAAASPDRPLPQPSRVALALSGGGARGLAHVGVLRALEEAAIPIDAIAANSMGAVVGGLYATGRSAGEIEAIVRSIDWASLFNGRPDRVTLPVAARVDRYAPLAGVSLDWKHVRLPAGLVPEHRVNRLLIEHLAPASYAVGGDFDALPIPFRAVAADLATGEPVVLARGDLARAVRASMSIPLAFPPVDWEGRTLVDGLIVNNLPIDVAKGFKPAVLVAIDIRSPVLEPSEYQSALGVVAQVNDLLTRRRNRDFEAEADVVVRPELGRHSTTDYSAVDELITKGYEATRAALPAIRAKLAEAGIAELAARRGGAGARALEGAPIREVMVRGNLRLEDALLRHTFNIPVGPRYEMAKALRAFDKVSATGLLERTWLEFEPESDGVRLVLRVTEAPPNRAEVSAGYTEWERARGAVRLRNQNTLGFGEQVELLLAGSDAETAATLSLFGDRLLKDGLGYRARVYSVTDKPRMFDAAGRSINRARFERTGFELSLRTALRRWVFLEGGVRLGRVRTREEAGIDLPEASDAVRVLRGDAVYDTLDSLSWPERGDRLAVSAEWSPSGLGADRAYRRLEVQARMARVVGRRTTLQLDAFGGLSGGLPGPYDWYRLGGAILIPGYAHEQLKGRQALAAATSVRYRAFGDVRLVVRAGAGNVFALAGDIRLAGVRRGVGIGAMVPTRVGPLSAELGLRDGGDTLLSFALGWD